MIVVLSLDIVDHFQGASWVAGLFLLPPGRRQQLYFKTKIWNWNRTSFFFSISISVCTCITAFSAKVPFSVMFFFFFHTLINAGAWLSQTLSVKANQFLWFSPIYVSMFRDTPHTSQSRLRSLLRRYIKLLCMGGMSKNKKISQLIHLPARKSHYTTDESKDCLRWKWGCVYGSAIVRTESPCLMWMENKRHADTPAKLILNTSLFKYFMIVHLFKHMSLKRCGVLWSLYMAAAKWRQIWLVGELIWPFSLRKEYESLLI